MPKQSAGILLFRKGEGGIEIFLVHPGGPFWIKKDLHSWSIPKGELDEDEDLLETAVREFEEETGTRVDGEFIHLTPVRQKGGKTVHCFAVMGDIDPASLRSNTFTIEWPPKSGKMRSFPEADRGEWFEPGTAMMKINESQAGFIKELMEKISHVSH